MAAASASDLVLDQSDWREASVLVDHSIFAIGDVHGCHHQLALLLDTFEALTSNRRARLVFVGDLICRGPDSLAALSLWAAPALGQGFGQVHRLSGNHEQLLMLSIGADESLTRAAYKKWMEIDGATFVDELRRATGRPDAALTRELLREAAGPEVLAQLETLEHSVRSAIRSSSMRASIHRSSPASRWRRRSPRSAEITGLDSGAVSRLAGRLRRHHGRPRSHAAAKTQDDVRLPGSAPP